MKTNSLFEIYRMVPWYLNRKQAIYLLFGFLITAGQLFIAEFCVSVTWILFVTGEPWTWNYWHDPFAALVIWGTLVLWSPFWAYILQDCFRRARNG